MKRTSVNLKLKRRLELVRMTVRDLTPAELRNVNGGDTTATGLACWTDCCDTYTKG